MMPPTLEKLNGSTIIQKMDNWRCADYWDSQDRAELKRWYRGGPLDVESDDWDVVGDQNFLLGYRYISKAFSELYSVLTRGRGMFQVKLNYASVSQTRKRYIEETASKELNRIIKKSKRLRMPYREVCGNAVMFGTPFLYRIDPYDWCPISDGAPLMPRNAPADIYSDEFLEWGFRASLTGKFILDQLKLSKSRKEGGRWNIKGLEDLLDQLFASQNNETASMFYPRERTPEEIESEVYRNAELSNVLDTSIPVYWFFRKRVDNKGKVDLYCVSRYGEAVGSTMTGITIAHPKSRTGVTVDPELFYEEARFERVDECLFPFHLDVSPGGELMMHEILGLGRLNYDIDKKVAELINVGLAGIEDDFTPLYTAQDHTSLEHLEQLMQNGLRRNAVLPEGIAPAEKGHRTKNYQQLFGMTAFFTEAESLNASSFNAGNPSRGRNELEVQALERQAESQRSVTNRMIAWNEAGDALAKAIFDVFSDGGLIQTDRGYPEVKEFQDRMKELGISMEEIAPELVDVHMQRLFGAGDRAIALNTLGAMMQNRGSYSPQTQEEILREWTAVMVDDYELAHHWVPEDPDPDYNQIGRAQSENNTALTQGVLPMVRPDDNAMIHVPQHAQGLATFLQSAQATGLDQDEAQRVTVLLAHMMHHQPQVAAVNPDMAKSMNQLMKQLAAAAEKLIIQPPTPQEQVRTQVAVQNAQLNERKQSFKEEQFERSQALREDQASHTQAIQLNQEARADRQAVQGSVKDRRDFQEDVRRDRRNFTQTALNDRRQNPQTQE